MVLFRNLYDLYQLCIKQSKKVYLKMFSVTLTPILIYSYLNSTYCTTLDELYCVQYSSLGVILDTTKYKDNNWPLIVCNILTIMFLLKNIDKRFFLVNNSSHKQNCFINNKKRLVYQKLFNTYSTKYFFGIIPSLFDLI